MKLCRHSALDKSCAKNVKKSNVRIKSYKKSPHIFFYHTLCSFVMIFIFAVFRKVCCLRNLNILVKYLQPPKSYKKLPQCANHFDHLRV